MQTFMLQQTVYDTTGLDRNTLGFDWSVIHHLQYYPDVFTHRSTCNNHFSCSSFAPRHAKDSQQFKGEPVMTEIGNLNPLMSVGRSRTCTIGSSSTLIASGGTHTSARLI